ncbi:MAG TPA: GntR family transcriptional regulator [Nitrolancea sp.]|nr:GntR family transcriptional regulator [Nitrolancea sp.]
MMAGLEPVYMPMSGAERLGSEVVMSDAQRTYVRLKEMIVTLGIRPGATIDETELQERLTVGRTPLREAVQRLSSDGLLQIYPRRAIVVAQLGVPEIHQIFEMRLVLEPAAAGLAAQIINAVEIEELKEISNELSDHRVQLDFNQFLHADHVFHRAVSACSRNMYLIDCADHILTLNQWLWHIYFDSRGVDRSALFQHEPIVDALAGHDVASATEAMRAHILCAKERLLSGL